MKAVVVHQYGGPEVLKFEEYPDPVPGAGQVLVRVAATSVNPIDYKRRQIEGSDFGGNSHGALGQARRGRPARRVFGL